MTHLASRLSEIGRSAAPISLRLALFFCGFGLKAALVPFHTWLPDAYPAAPAPISALLSGVVSKVIGVYVLARLLFNVFGITDDMLLLMRWMGGITMVVGGLLALGQWDIKRLFAYSSVSQVGLIVLALGFGTTWGVVGALYHLVNHAVFKPLLFLCSGQVEVAAGTRDLRKMRRTRTSATGHLRYLHDRFTLAGRHSAIERILEQADHRRRRHPNRAHAMGDHGRGHEHRGFGVSAESAAGGFLLER